VDQDGQLTGILTKGDITRGLLRALQRNYQVEEVRRYRASHLFEDINSDRTSLILRYRIKPTISWHGGNASSNIKRALLRLGANPQIARRMRYRHLRSRDEPDHPHHQRRNHPVADRTAPHHDESQQTMAQGLPTLIWRCRWAIQPPPKRSASWASGLAWA
jgi:hypothetical protein